MKHFRGEPWDFPEHRRLQPVTEACLKSDSTARANFAQRAPLSWSSPVDIWFGAVAAAGSRPRSSLEIRLAAVVDIFSALGIALELVEEGDKPLDLVLSLTAKAGRAFKRGLGEGRLAVDSNCRSRTRWEPLMPIV
jgi:hypothetical protein